MEVLQVDSNFWYTEWMEMQLLIVPIITLLTCDEQISLEQSHENKALLGLAVGQLVDL
uniref:Uncharacterized protein n=1 Tax=Heterorhabditis bacteriophora TaxID=37862 RepID=A0A1I7WLA3_HETBA